MGIIFLKIEVMSSVAMSNKADFALPFLYGKIESFELQEICLSLYQNWYT